MHFWALSSKRSALHKQKWKMNAQRHFMCLFGHVMNMWICVCCVGVIQHIHFSTFPTKRHDNGHVWYMSLQAQRLLFLKRMFVLWRFALLKNAMKVKKTMFFQDNWFMDCYIKDSTISRMIWEHFSMSATYPGHPQVQRSWRFFITFL